jgi:hypothetical protein
MKKMISLFVSICLLGGIAVVSVYNYHRSHKVWIPATDEEVLDGVVLLAEQSVYREGEITLSFQLTNDSAQTISFDATVYHSDGETTYQDSESPIYLQKMVNGQWCRWEVPEQYRGTPDSTAGVEAEVASGMSCGPFVMHSYQYLDQLSAGSYRAAFPFHGVGEASELHSYEAYAEFEVSS